MADAESVVNVRQYPCGIKVTGPMVLPEACPEHGADCEAIQRIARVLTADLTPWTFNGSEPICRELLDAALGRSIVKGSS